MKVDKLCDWNFWRKRKWMFIKGSHLYLEYMHAKKLLKIKIVKSK